MHTKPGFTLRTMMGKHILVAEGAQQATFSKIVSFNDTAAELWRAVEDRDFTADDLATILVDNYSVDRETALADVNALVEKWRAEGLVD